MLYLGTKRADITPPIGARLYGYPTEPVSESVHDPLTATAFYFEEDDKRAILISISVCEMRSALADAIRREISEKTGVPPRYILLCATHTHTGPNVYGQEGWGDLDSDYTDKIFTPAIIKIGAEAVKNAVPVRMGVSIGESAVGINRREKNAEGRVILGQNPEGARDPRMTVISFKNGKDEIVASIIHYGTHGTAAGADTAISEDWPGIMCRRVEKETGAIAAFFNGAEGDVGPRLPNGQTTGDIKMMEELGEKAGEDAVRIFKETKKWEDVSLYCDADVLKLPTVPRLSEKEAREKLAALPEGKIGVARFLAGFYNRIINSYAENYKEKSFREFPQTIIAVGKVRFVEFGYEVFAGIAENIRRAAGDAVLPISLVNGTVGYFPTEDQLPLGGYEVEMFRYQDIEPLTDDADRHLAEKTVAHLRKIPD